jgi:hypothetical protein
MQTQATLNSRIVMLAPVRNTALRKAQTMTMFVGAAMLALTGLAQADNPPALSVDQAALVKQTCSDTMRIRQGYVQYQACVESLSATLVKREEVKRLSSAYDICTNKEHLQGSSQFAQCVLNQKNAPANLPQGGAVTVNDAAPASTATRSFTESDAEGRRALEERACANLGLTPGQAAFGDCVTHLDVNLWTVANPS